MSREREKTGNETLGKNGHQHYRPDGGDEGCADEDRRSDAGEWLKSAGADGEAIVKAYRAK